MGSSGSKRRKPRRRLPKVHGDPPPAPEPNAATPLSPAGFPQAMGTIARATSNPNRRQRRAGSWIVALPVLLAAVVALLVLITR